MENKQECSFSRCHETFIDWCPGSVLDFFCQRVGTLAQKNYLSKRTVKADNNLACTKPVVISHKQLYVCAEKILSSVGGVNPYNPHLHMCATTSNSKTRKPCCRWETGRCRYNFRPMRRMQAVVVSFVGYI